MLENKHLLKNAEELLESQFGKTRFKDSDSDINFYTEFQNYKTLLLLLACNNFLNLGENGENIVNVNSATGDLEFSAPSSLDGSQGNKPDRRRKLSTLALWSLSE